MVAVILAVARGVVVTLEAPVEAGMVAAPAVGVVATGAGEVVMAGATRMLMGVTAAMAGGDRIGGIPTGIPIGPVGAGGGPCLMPMAA
ncbi:hypothetical protein [Acetobacter okinawensis]|nr:hypothetical protein [Acetobacter okinawensis]